MTSPYFVNHLSNLSTCPPDLGAAAERIHKDDGDSTGKGQRRGQSGPKIEFGIVRLLWHDGSKMLQLKVKSVYQYILRLGTFKSGSGIFGEDLSLIGGRFFYVFFVLPNHVSFVVQDRKRAIETQMKESGLQKPVGTRAEWGQGLELRSGVTPFMWVIVDGFNR